MSIPGGPEMLVILLVLVLLFGASRLPRLARSVGQAGKEFRTGLREGAGPDEDPTLEGER